ncbi:MAG TPA: sulfotransferase [Blastocatellia bacterium]
MDDKTFIFLGGLHRSGTSLLHQIMRSHPLVSGFQNTGAPEDEGQHLQTVYPPASEFGGPGRFGFDERSFMSESHSLASTSNAGKLFSEWGERWDLRRDYLIEKSPPNLVRARFLQAIFPRSMFIMITRHPIAVAYATQKWSGTSITSLIEHWLLCHERFLSDLPRLRKCFVIRYEDFVARPQEVMDEVYRFVGINSEPLNRDVHKHLDEKYYNEWSKDHQTTRLPLSYEERANRFGYSFRSMRATATSSPKHS